MITLRYIYTLFFLVGWFFFPFNDFHGIPAFGEFSNEAGAFFFITGFLFLGIEILYKGKIGIPYNHPIFKVLFLFFGWCFVTILLNFSSVSTNYYKHTGGFYRFIRQYASLLIPSFIFLIFFWNVIKNWSTAEILAKIRKVLLISLIFVFVYGFLETLIVVFHLNFLKYILAIFDYFPFLDVNYVGGDRISSVAYESPSLGNYLITISGWMFSYIISSKSKYKYVPTLMVLFLMFFSGSRTALINITVQLLILISVMYAMPVYRRNVINFLKYGLVIVVGLLIVNGSKMIKSVDEKVETLNFSKNLHKSISNQSRFGMQYASLQVFKKHPIVGVGFGQETYHKRFHYPSWAKKDNWEFRVMYENNNFRSFPSAYNMYTRLLAETGIIGAFIFIYLLYLCLKNAIFLFKNTQEDSKIVAFILIISFAGLSLNWLQTDFFRQHGFWLCLAILVRTLQINPFKQNKLVVD